MSAWKWLFGPRKQAPKKVRVHLVPDTGQDPLQWNVPFIYFRVLVGMLIIGLLALLFLIFSSGSLFLEKQRRQMVERRLDEMTRRVAKVHSLETQLEETTFMLLKIQGMLGVRPVVPDSLLRDLVAREAESGRAPRLLTDTGLRVGPQMTMGSPTLWPLSGWVARAFSDKRGMEYHPGMDIVAPEGTAVCAAGDGMVLVAGWNDENGNFVLLDHGFGITSLYAHNGSLAVRKEDRIRVGEVIAFAGNTGRAQGPHLHFEVRRNGIPVDPKNYLLDGS